MTGNFETVVQINPATDLTPLQRRANRTRFQAWIGRDIVRRANHDVSKSYMFYNKDKEFINFALVHKLNDEVLPMLRAKGVYYWSKGM